jgi:curved DNA-binding protein CbpA
VHQKKSDNTKYYDILGVSKDATPNELNKTYRKVAIKNQLDKGGDPKKVTYGYFMLFLVRFGMKLSLE